MEPRDKSFILDFRVVMQSLVVIVSHMMYVVDEIIYLLLVSKIVIFTLAWKTRSYTCSLCFNYCYMSVTVTARIKLKAC